jgi:hypothetical protein
MGDEAGKFHMVKDYDDGEQRDGDRGRSSDGGGEGIAMAVETLG